MVSAPSAENYLARWPDCWRLLVWSLSGLALKMIGYEPTSWCVVFNLDGESGWSKWVPGRFKHVRAYAFLTETRTWLFYDVNFGGTEIRAIPDGPAARAAIWEFIGPPGRSYVVSVPKLPRRRRILPWSNWCTSALRHLLNVPGSALRPSAFYRDCLDNGGTPFEADDGRAEVSATPN